MIRGGTAPFPGDDEAGRATGVPCREIAVVPLPPSDAPGDGWRLPVLIKSRDKAARGLGPEAAAALDGRLEWGRERLLMVRWSGSDADRLEFAVAESRPDQVVFHFRPERTRNRVVPVRFFAIRANVRWVVRPPTPTAISPPQDAAVAPHFP